jgi:hypothetical protein
MAPVSCPITYALKIRALGEVVNAFFLIFFGVALGRPFAGPNASQDQTASQKSKLRFLCCSALFPVLLNAAAL